MYLGVRQPHVFYKPSVKIKMVGKMFIICENNTLVGSETEIIFASFNENTLVGKMEIIIIRFDTASLVGKVAVIFIRFYKVSLVVLKCIRQYF